MVLHRSGGILVKRSASEGPPNREQSFELPQHRHFSTSLHRSSGRAKGFAKRSTEVFRDVQEGTLVQPASLAAATTQSASPQRKLRTMNYEWSNEEEATLACDAVFEATNPRRTVSFAPVRQIDQLSLSECSSPTSGVHYSHVSLRAELPRALQAGIRPDTPDRQGIRFDPAARTPRQLALWEDEELVADVHGWFGYFERTLGTSREVHIHVNMLDERMREIASEGSWGKPSLQGLTTHGYVAAMRRQHYADAYTSFRLPDRSLTKNLSIYKRPSHSRGNSLPLKQEQEGTGEDSQMYRARRSKSLREVALEI